MTTRTSSSLNLDLIGEIFAAIATERAPLVPERFEVNYPDEDVEAYVAAFLDPNSVVLMEDAQIRPHLRAVKPAARELAHKIRNSGGWKIFVDKYGIDKILFGIAVSKGIDNADAITEAVNAAIQLLITLP